MRITITARHTAIDDDLRTHARELVEKVSKLVRRALHAQVTFTEDAGLAAVEIAVHAPRGRTYVAKGQESDHRSALDGAIGRLKRQVLDEKESPRPRRARPPRAAPKVSGPR